MNVLVAIAVGVLIFAAALMIMTAYRRIVMRRRMNAYAPSAKRAVRPNVDRGTIMAGFERQLERLGLHQKIVAVLERAGIDASAGAVVVLDLLAGVIAYALMATRSGFLAALLVGVGVGALPWVVLVVKGMHRSRAFENQLPEVLDTLSASLRAGHGFDAALQTVANDLAEPAAREFRRVLTEVHLGRSLEDSLSDLGERIRSEDLKFVLDAIVIQRQVGGSLAELFELVVRDGPLAGAVPSQGARAHRHGAGVGERAHVPAVRRRDRPDADQPDLHEPALDDDCRSRDGRGRARDDDLRDDHAAADRDGKGVTMLLLLLAGLSLAGAVFVVADSLTPQGRRRTASVAMVRRFSGTALPRRRRNQPLVSNDTLEDIGRRFTSDQMRERLPNRIAAAGLAGKVTPESFAALRLGLVGLAALSVIAFGTVAGLSGGLIFLLVGVGCVLAWVFPGYYLDRRARSRREAISSALPEALDLLAVCVEAGLGLFGAIQRLVETERRPARRRVRARSHRAARG